MLIGFPLVVPLKTSERQRTEQPSGLLEFEAPLVAEKEQGPEHAHPVAVEGITARTETHGLRPGVHQHVETDPVNGGWPVTQKTAQGGRGFRQLFSMGEVGDLLDRGTLTEAARALTASAVLFILLQTFSDVFELADQLPQGDRSLQGWGGHGSTPEMALRPAGQS